MLNLKGCHAKMLANHKVEQTGKETAFTELGQWLSNRADIPIFQVILVATTDYFLC